MSGNDNHRESGARKYPAKTEADANEEFSQDAATNKKPVGEFGLSEKSSDRNEKTRHFDGQNPPHSPEQTSPPPATVKE
jgi:hypothetical protein